MRALIIDDSKAMRKVLGRTMSNMGFEVDEAMNGEEAIVLLEQSANTGIVLVDWNLPEMSGLDFVKAIRSTDQYDSVRLMMVTSDTDEDQMATAFQAGVDEYVTKPFTDDIIRDKVRVLGLAS
jgi:two-component system chemotaxis response regulator CheY